MEKELQSDGIEMVTKSEILELGLDTWNRKRSTEEIMGFIARREAQIADFDEDMAFAA